MILRIAGVLHNISFLSYWPTLESEESIAKVLLQTLEE